MNHLNAADDNPQRTEDSSSSPLWKIYLDKGQVSEALAFYTPDDITEINDRNELKKLYLIYTFTDREPSVYDVFYMRTMSFKIREKLSDFHGDAFDLVPYVIGGLKYRFDV